MCCAGVARVGPGGSKATTALSALTKKMVLAFGHTRFRPTHPPQAARARPSLRLPNPNGVWSCSCSSASAQARGSALQGVVWVVHATPCSAAVRRSLAVDSNTPPPLSPNPRPPCVQSEVQVAARTPTSSLGSAGPLTALRRSEGLTGDGRRSRAATTEYAFDELEVGGQGQDWLAGWRVSIHSRAPQHPGRPLLTPPASSSGLPADIV